MDRRIGSDFIAFRRSVYRIFIFSFSVI